MRSIKVTERYVENVQRTKLGRGHHTNLYVEELLSRKGRTNPLIRS